MRIFLLALLSLASLASADETDRAYEAIADYTVNRDKVLKRHAMMAVVEHHEFARQAQINPMIFFRLRIGNLDWRGCAYMQAGASRNQRWSQWVTRDGVTTAIDEFGREATREKDEDLWKFFGRSVQMPMLDVFDDISSGSFTDNNPPGTMYHADMQRVFVTGPSELVSLSTIGSEMKAKWKFQKFDAHVRFDISKGDMPIEIRMKGLVRDQIWQVRWRKSDGQWLPMYIRHVDEKHKLQHFLKMDWLVGEKVPKGLAEENVDLRIEVPKLFGFVSDQWNPQRSGTPYETPPDLYHAFDAGDE